MGSLTRFLTIVLALACELLCMSVAALGDEQPGPAFQIRLDAGHPWRPPFGLERVGRPIAVVVEAGARPDPANCMITAFLKGKEGASYPVRFPAEGPRSARVTLEKPADLLVLSSDPKPGEKPVELARQAIQLPEFEADADREARHDHQSRRPGNDPGSRGLAASGPGTNGDARDRRDQPHARLARSAA